MKISKLKFLLISFLLLQVEHLNAGIFDIIDGASRAVQGTTDLVNSAQRAVDSTQSMSSKKTTSSSNSATPSSSNQAGGSSLSDEQRAELEYWKKANIPASEEDFFWKVQQSQQKTLKYLDEQAKRSRKDSIQTANISDVIYMTDAIIREENYDLYEEMGDQIREKDLSGIRMRDFLY